MHCLIATFCSFVLSYYIFSQFFSPVYSQSRGDSYFFLGEAQKSNKESSVLSNLLPDIPDFVGLSEAFFVKTRSKLEGVTQEKNDLTFFEGDKPKNTRYFFEHFFPTSKKGDFWFGAPPSKKLVFWQFETNGKEYFLGKGFKYAIKSNLNQSGWRTMLFSSQKLHEYDCLTDRHINRMDGNRLFLGYEGNINHIYYSLFAGLSSSAFRPEAVLITGKSGRIGAVALIELKKDWGTFSAPSAISSIINYNKTNEDNSTSSNVFQYTTTTFQWDSTTQGVFLRGRHNYYLKNLGFSFGTELSLSRAPSIFQSGYKVQNSWFRKSLGVHIGDISLFATNLSFSVGREWNETHKPSFHTNMLVSLYF